SADLLQGLPAADRAGAGGNRHLRAALIVERVSLRFADAVDADLGHIAGGRRLLSFERRFTLGALDGDVGHLRAAAGGALLLCSPLHGLRLDRRRRQALGRSARWSATPASRSIGTSPTRSARAGPSGFEQPSPAAPRKSDTPRRRRE